jgi:hypothetical protein
MFYYWNINQMKDYLPDSTKNIAFAKKHDNSYIFVLTLKNVMCWAIVSIQDDVTALFKILIMFKNINSTVTNYMIVTHAICKIYILISNQYKGVYNYAVFSMYECYCGLESGLITYGGSYMFRHYIVILRERS